MPIQPIFQRNNILVTGGAGFIGSHLCEILLKTNKVICIDNFSTGSEENINHLLDNPYFKFVRHDIHEPFDIEKMADLSSFNIKFQGLQEVYNLACPTSRKEYKHLEINTALSNSLGIKNILEIVRKYKSKFLHFSSSVVYGNPLNDEPIPEDYWGFVNHLDERAAYNEGKRFAETLINVYSKNYDLNAKIARIFNIYGPRMQLNSGRMLPDFVSSALKNEVLTIYGKETTINTYCFISDCIDAIMRYMKSDAHIPVLNIGNPDSRPIKMIAEKIIEITGSKSKITYYDALPSVNTACIPDITKAKNILGWFPLVPLGKGLEQTVKDMQVSSRIFHI